MLIIVIYFFILQKEDHPPFQIEKQNTIPRQQQRCDFSS